MACNAESDCTEHGKHLIVGGITALHGPFGLGRRARETPKLEAR